MGVRYMHRSDRGQPDEKSALDEDEGESFLSMR